MQQSVADKRPLLNKSKYQHHIAQCDDSCEPLRGGMRAHVLSPLQIDLMEAWESWVAKNSRVGSSLH